MINHKFLDRINYIFDHPKDISAKDIEALIIETVQFFTSFQTLVSSKDPKDQEIAIQEANQIQQKLDQLTEKAFALTGISKEKAMEAFNNIEDFTSQSPEKFAEIKEHLQSLKIS